MRSTIASISLLSHGKAAARQQWHLLMDCTVQVQAQARQKARNAYQLAAIATGALHALHDS